MDLLALTQEAASKCSTYRHADLSDWVEAIDPVLEAAGEATIGSDRVDNIDVSGETLTIETSYSVRCCAQTHSVKIPVAILRAQDPVKAAHQYRLSQAINETQRDIDLAQRAVEQSRAKMVLLQTELAALSE